MGTKTSIPKRSTGRGAWKQTQRAKAARHHRQLNLLLFGGAAVFVMLIGLVVYASIRRQQPIGDEQTVPSLGNVHIQQDAVSPVAYNSMPPTSGPHYDTLAPWGISNTPLRYEEILHNLEDGGVAIYYQCPEGCPELVAQLEEIVQPYGNAGRRLILAPNDPAWTVKGSQPLHAEMENRIALTAWQRLDRFDEFNSDRIRTFIDRYEGIDHHR